MRIRGPGSYKPAFGNKVYNAPKFYRPSNPTRFAGHGYVTYPKVYKKRPKISKMKTMSAKKNVAAKMIQAAFRGKRLRNFLFKK